MKVLLVGPVFPRDMRWYYPRLLDDGTVEYAPTNASQVLPSYEHPNKMYAMRSADMEAGAFLFVGGNLAEFEILAGVLSALLVRIDKLERTQKSTGRLFPDE